MWKLSCKTHNYFIEPLGGTHLKNMIYSRFIKFLQSILKSNKKAAIYLLFRTIRDQRTITGGNVQKILSYCEETDIFEVNLNKFKKNFKFCELPEGYEWKINLVKELTDIKMNILSVNFDDSILSFDDSDKILYDITTQ